MVFWAHAPFSEWGLVCPDMKIVAFCYYTPLPMPKTLIGDYIAGRCGYKTLGDVNEKDLIKWHGFGSGY